MMHGQRNIKLMEHMLLLITLQW